MSDAHSLGWICFWLLLTGINSGIQKAKRGLNSSMGKEVSFGFWSSSEFKLFLALCHEAGA